MKKVKMLIQTLRLYKKIGNDLEKEDKRNFTNEQLKEQFEKGKVMKKNIRELRPLLFTFCAMLFLLPIVISLIAYDLSNNQILSVITLSTPIPFSLMIFIFQMTPTRRNLEIINNQMYVNSLLKEKNNGNKNVFVIEKKLHVNSFNQMYNLSNMKTVIVDNTHDCITLYFISDNGNIKVVYPEDTINTLIEKGKITIEDYINAVEAS